MSIPGFTPGQKAQNTVVAAMYLVMIVAVVGGVAMFVGFPGSGDTNPAAGQSGAGPATETTAPPEQQSQENSSGWVSVSNSNGSGDSSTASFTERVREEEVQQTIIRKSMANSSLVDLQSSKIQQKEIYIRYTQDISSQSDVASGVGAVTGILYEMVVSGFDVQAIHGELVNDNGQVTHTFTVNSETVEKHNSGQITDEELRQRLKESINQTGQASSTAAI